MHILEAIHTRRSVRQFTQEPVTDKEIRTLLDAAMAAPSAGNARPWRFIIVQDKSFLEEIARINPYAAMAPKAPLGILVCGDLKAEKFPGYWVQDCSAAVQNILLAARGTGLATVWTGIYPMEDRVAGFRALCGLPEHVVPMAYLVVGRSIVEQKHVSRYEAEKVSLNRLDVPLNLSNEG